MSHPQQEASAAAVAKQLSGRRRKRQEIRADIEQTRGEFGDTVSAVCSPPGMVPGPR